MSTAEKALPPMAAALEAARRNSGQTVIPAVEAAAPPAPPPPAVVPDDDFSEEVIVRRVTFSNEESGYGVIKVVPKEAGDELTVVGTVAHLREGENAHIAGSWKNSPKYGPQLQAREAIPLEPATKKGLTQLLTNVKHIGQSRAETLVGALGEGVLSKIDSDPFRAFRTLRGINDDKAKEAADSWEQLRITRELHVTLGSHGLSYLAARIVRHFGDRARSVLRDEPYLLTQIKGIGFTIADQLGKAAGISPDAPERAQAAAVYILGECENEGHSFLPEDELVKRVTSLIGSEPTSDVLSRAESVYVDRDLAIERRFYRTSIFHLERGVAKDLGALAGYEHDTLPLIREKSRPETNLSEEQWAAVTAALSSSLSVITGGPGTGKSASCKAIVELGQGAGLKIGLCAPTGKAARRLETATGRPASTIHRMIGWMPGRPPTFDLENPLPYELLICDESSMLNLRTMALLLSAIAQGTRIVFVGDVDQLPPVGAGRPFAELIDSGVCPVTRLTRIFRQAARSMIVSGAHEVNHGRVPTFSSSPPLLGKDADESTPLSDLFFHSQPNVTQLLDDIVYTVAERIPAAMGLDPVEDVQVLSCMYAGPVGIDAMNKALRERLNPLGKGAFKDKLRIGDKLVGTRNLPEHGVMNGTIARLIDDNPEAETICLRTDVGEEVEVPYEFAPSFKMAYATSVHRAQGIEVPAVVVVTHRSQMRMLTRPLVYTAMTRAKGACVFAGEKYALHAAVSKGSLGERYSGLAERLRA